MLGRVLAAILIIGGPVLTGMGANTNAPRTDSCSRSCMIVRADYGAGYAALDESVARIAVRAGTLGTEPATTKGEWLSLYLLLSLRANGKDTAL